MAGDLDRLFERIKKDKGKLDVVFANAGIAKYAALGSIDEEFFDSIIDTNVKVLTVQKALPLLPEIFHGDGMHDTSRPGICASCIAAKGPFCNSTVRAATFLWSNTRRAQYACA